jgi:hypothetical protein
MRNGTAPVNGIHTLLQVVQKRGYYSKDYLPPYMQQTSQDSTIMVATSSRLGRRRGMDNQSHTNNCIKRKTRQSMSAAIRSPSPKSSTQSKAAPNLKYIEIDDNPPNGSMPPMNPGANLVEDSGNSTSATVPTIEIEEDRWRQVAITFTEEDYILRYYAKATTPVSAATMDMRTG